MRSDIISKSDKETMYVAEILAGEILKSKNPSREAFVIAMNGDLGTGKTTFTKGLAKGLGIKKRILSPTFVLSKKYEFRGKYYKNLIHVDCYRLKGDKIVKSIKWSDILKDKKNIIIIEWSDKIRKYLPKKRLNIAFKHKNTSERLLTVISHG